MKRSLTNMKKIISFLVLILMTIIAGCEDNYYDQTCRGNYIITNKNQIKSLIRCSVLNGDIIIEGTNLENLNGLVMLRSVSNLYIENNLLLNNMAGLNNLLSIKGNVVIRNNDSLKIFTGFSLLRLVEGELIIDGNDSLISLAGFHNLSSVGSTVSIYNNIDLPPCEVQNFLDQLGDRSQMNDSIYGNTGIKECN